LVRRHKDSLYTFGSVKLFSGGFHCRLGGEDAELVLVKGSRDDLLSLMDGLRPVSGVREVNSALTNGWAQSKLKH
jgi:hypothetical protein